MEVIRLNDKLMYIDGFSLIQWATYFNSLDCVKLLQVYDKNDGKCIFTAALYGYYECLRFLLMNSKYTFLSLYRHNISGKTHWYTPLMIAAIKENLSCVDILVDVGCNIDAVNNEGVTALMFACIHGKDSSVKLLLEQGADVNLQVGGWDAITFATDGNHYGCLDLCLKAGAKPNNMAVIRAVEKGHHKCLHLLMEAGFSVNVNIRKNCSALRWAIRNDFGKCVKLLVG